MKTELVRIGNAQGICLPDAFIEAACLGGEVEVTLELGAVVIRGNAPHPRAGWAEAFEALGPDDDDYDDDWADENWDELPHPRFAPADDDAKLLC